jgi:hypothetical protein
MRIWNDRYEQGYCDFLESNRELGMDFYFCSAARADPGMVSGDVMIARTGEPGLPDTYRSYLVSRLPELARQPGNPGAGPMLQVAMRHGLLTQSGPAPYRRNSDEQYRRRARRSTSGYDQATIDRIVVDKIRSGRADTLTLFEIQNMSPRLVRQGIVPAQPVQQAFQALFDNLAFGPGIARLEWRGADLSLFESSEDYRLVVMLETGGIDERFKFQGGDEIPAVRFYVNEDRVETAADGSWEPGL